MTHVGKWLRSRALLQPVGTGVRLSDSLDRTGWWHAHSVSAAVCELAVKDAYGPDRRTLAVPGLVEAMRKYFGADGVERIPQEAGEVLVWAALGHDVSTRGIDITTAIIAQVLIFLGLAWDLDYGEAEVDAALVKAEALAFERGYSPTLDGKLRRDHEFAVLLRAPNAAKTVVGRWVRARALGLPAAPVDPDDDLRQLTDSHDGRHVFDALLEVSVQRRFAYRRQGGDIAAFASTVVARDGMDDVSVEAAEALIRSRLGEKVSLCGISLDVAVRIAVACFLQAVADLSLSTDQIDALVLSAEQLAWSRGHRPLQAI